VTNPLEEKGKAVPIETALPNSPVMPE